MEWDSWPNQGYPCQECGQRGTCLPTCKLRENDLIVSKSEQTITYPIKLIDYNGLHLSCCGRPIEDMKKVSLNCFCGETRHAKCNTIGCECSCHEQTNN